MFKALSIIALLIQVSVHALNDLEIELQGVKTKVKDFTLYLETDFPNSHHAIGTITWQCHRVAEAIQNVINELATRTSDPTFKQFSFSLQEVHTSLQQIALSTDVNEVTSIKSQLIANVQLACEILEKMAHVTHIHYPDFRVKLQAILRDFSKGLRTISGNIKMERGGDNLHWSPKELALKIEKLTQSILTKLVDGRDAFQWYSEGIRGVLKNLKSMKTVSDDELDVVLLRLTRKFERIQSVVDQGGMSRDLKSIVAIYVTDIASLCKQLVHYIENGSQGEQGDRFIEQVMYDYYHVLESIRSRLQ